MRGGNFMELLKYICRLKIEIFGTKKGEKWIFSWREALSSTDDFVTGGGGTSAQYKIDQNLLNFQARSPKFHMVVALD